MFAFSSTTNGKAVVKIADAFLRDNDHLESTQGQLHDAAVALAATLEKNDVVNCFAGIQKQVAVMQQCQTFLEDSVKDPTKLKIDFTVASAVDELACIVLASWIMTATKVEASHFVDPKVSKNLIEFVLAWNEGAAPG
jgi:hypothetical protein